MERASFVNGCRKCLSTAPRRSRRIEQELIAQLQQKMGQLTMEVDWLKKKSKQLGL